MVMDFSFHVYIPLGRNGINFETPGISANTCRCLSNQEEDGEN